ncbi:two component transcriptional regulator, Fis family [Desulfofustis glycolicus DSM 9705]|uniref:Two component transcriptional regulator, Fis family n=2 Tax=Desulfofustis glycolicus TaxID=51195 RepID=A0A1M5X2H3_9BACT|nr:two component transcriptional regulator, Fis family [Desulfofustis glycolicus DSM 9705]
MTGSEMKSPQTSEEAIAIRMVIVDDEQDFAQGLARLITGNFPRIRVAVCTSGKQALQEMAERPAQLMITDLRMPEMGGMHLLAETLKHHPDISVVVLSAYGTVETAVQALHNGAYDFLTKPIEPEHLFRVVEKGLERSRLLRENSRLQQVVIRQDTREELVGEGPAIQRLRSTITTVARSEYTVLIRGESGTGKEVTARLIHRFGPRAAKPFLAVDCPSIPENLLESELFGYVKGAFTGADRDHRGLFVAADGGTIHLDEIGDISPPIQAKLLRCLQHGEVRPIGSSQTCHVDVRVIASTNRDLEAAMKSGLFREDLFYRLNVLSITIPPIRDRIEDIPLLARHLLNCACREAGISEPEMTPDVMQWLSNRPWPGNVRELQNVIRRLSVFCNGELIDMDLVRRVFNTSHMPQAQATDEHRSGQPPASYKDAKATVVNAFTLNYVEQLLTATGGNVSEAARIAGLSRVALQKIFARLGIDVASYRGHSTQADALNTNGKHR